MSVERELIWAMAVLRKMVEPVNLLPTRDDVREAVEI